MPKIELTFEVDRYEIHAVIKTKIGKYTDYTKHFIGTLTEEQMEKLFESTKE